jgi:hypothetical protein
MEGTHTCTPGAMITAACSADCGLGSCDGDSVMRICNGTSLCPDSEALATNDDSGCGSGECGRGGDCCSQATFTCPAGGEYTVLVAAYRASRTVMCDVAISP